MPRAGFKPTVPISGSPFSPLSNCSQLHHKCVFVCPANDDHPVATGLAYYRAVSLSASASLHGPYTIMFGYLLKEANNGPVIGILISWTSNKAAIHTGQVLHLVCPSSGLDYRQHYVQKEES
jgi:hypothetical protein